MDKLKKASKARLVAFLSLSILWNGMLYALLGFHLR